MLADAFHAENYRFWKNRMAVLWSIAFVPVMAVALGVVGNIALKANSTRLVEGPNAPPELAAALTTGGSLDLGQAMVAGAAQLAGAPLLLFVLIGAVTIFAGDYRWETWRLISARNTRPNLLLGKVGAVALVGLVALLLMTVANLASEAIKAAVFERRMTFTMDGGDAGRLVLLTLLAWWRVIQFVLLGLLAAVMTRSLLAALFIPIVVGVATSIAPNVFAGMGVGPDSWLSVMVHVGGAFEAIATALNPQVGETLPEGLLVKAWTSALVWTAIPLAGAMLWFRRQDLSKE